MSDQICRSQVSKLDIIQGIVSSRIQVVKSKPSSWRSHRFARSLYTKRRSSQLRQRRNQ